ncbi:pyridoxal phosphate-dependent aminotransferase [uncultured Litoreibacter sp.]|uniref:pyridoxal phosphate-dependent aminotransferase n=1 Tax=uncultured Litoreibacter sp. TaxID=1392394 RepID=UPI00263548FE|nr:pyridoxal phosphate-dependent aminotransferase [uncultured Litoreibacter sp.]
MKLSQRILGLTGGTSDGWELFNKARRMIDDGVAVTELTIGEHDIRTHQSILDAMHRSASAGHTGYAMIPGTNELRDAVAARVFERTGVPTTRDNVLITPGGQSGLFSAHSALCDEGDVALFCDPYYATYPGTIRAVGAVPRAVPCRFENSFEPSFPDIVAKTRDAKTLLVNSPNNPTGVVYSRETMEGIARACCEHDLWCISDEVYDTQVWDGTHISPRTLDGMLDRTLVIGSMSKSHAMTGSRVGWVVGPEPVIKEMINLATHTNYGVPGYIQDAAAFAIESGQPLEDEIGAPFKRRRSLGQAIIAQQNAVGLVPSSGAMYMLLDIRSTGLSGDEFADRLLETHHIAVMPGESFGACAAGHIRVAMTVEDSAFETALHTLVDFAKGVE